MAIVNKVQAGNVFGAVNRSEHR